jgi:hypothetical protein
MRPLFFACVLTLGDCASPLAQRSQRAEGLIDFLSGDPGEVTCDRDNRQ